jgi:hypothetical protein
MRVRPFLRRTIVATDRPQVDRDRPLPHCPSSKRCSIGRHGGPDELPEGSCRDLLAFAQVDRTPRVPFQAGIEEILQRLPTKPK